MTLCFSDEIDDYWTFFESSNILDKVVPHDEYVDEMIAMSLSQIKEIAPFELASPFDLFGVSILEIVEEIQVAPVLEIAEDVIVVDGLFDGLVGLIFDIDDEIAQHDSDDDSSSISDSDPIDQRVSHVVGDIEIFYFGTADQPRELRIGSDLSVDERDSLIQLLIAYLDIFAWSYEDMPSLDPSIIQHRLPLLPHIRPVKQKLTRLHPRWSLQDGKVKVCVDFRDLSKVNPKDDFPLPHIDMLIDSTAGHSMLSFMDGFSGCNQILMTLEDMEKMSFITEWGTYCYRVMSFGLKNAGATYQRAVTTLFHDMMHRDVEVYVGNMIVKSQDRPDHLTALERFFERIRQFRLRLNPKKCTFGVTSGKLLGYMVNERGIKVDPDKIKAILDMPAPRIEREVRGFLGRLQYISRFLARLTDICEPIFRLLRKSQPTIWDDQCQRAFERIREYLLSPPVLAPPTPEVHQREHCRGSPSSLPVSDGRAIDDDFPDEDVAVVTSLSGWRMYFDGAANHSGYGIGVLLISPHGLYLGIRTALELGIRQIEVFGDSNLVLRQIQGKWKTRNVKLRPYHAYLKLLVGRFDDLIYTHLPRAQNQFADALATLASMIDIPTDEIIETVSHRLVICGKTLYRRSADEMLLLYLDRASANRVIREVHARVCRPHMGGHMLARKIMRIGYFWLTMEIDCFQFVQRCPECQIHGDLIHISPKSSSGHEFILVAIDYFTKWVEAASYARLTSSGVASFIRSSAYRPQTNGAVETVNKNIKRILRRMIKTSRDWFEKLPFALWAYRTSFHTSTGATPYSLVYNMEVVLPVEIELGSLRVALEQQMLEADWAQSRFDQLNLQDERRLRAADHIRAYQRKMARTFKKQVKL
ncbi:Transposon Ty3-I Gag-Pol polyprotein [Vitis vinifera]|uniref:Transposon Ty3-I Gag-Pol polyprotein n=1 Tax=Vitis vinifera TaxID=29760 RepID=A0A438IXC1_VITVI|nr:Transposon Ty3-I Gag-Pol polyprotein [Vitis vinifera]